MRLYLQAQYQIFISVILSITILALTALLLYYSKQSSYEVRQASAELMEQEMLNQAREKGVALVSALSNNLVNPYYNFKIEDIYRLLENAKTNKNVVGVLVFDDSGVIQHDGTREIERFGQLVNDREMIDNLLGGSGTFSKIRNDLLTIAYPIQLGDQILGGVSLTMSLKSIKEKIATMNSDLIEINSASRNRQLTSATVVAIVALCISLVFGVLLARYLVSPIRQLVEATKKIGEGDYAFTLDLRRRDELGELADAFNTMSLNLVEHQREVHHIAYHDTLTKLPNRLMMKKLLNKAIADTQAAKSLMALMLIDLDDFKQVNDTMGHDAGDLLLQQAAERIAHEVRGHHDLVLRGDIHDLENPEVVSRLGGDEFTVLAVDLASKADASTIAKRIIEALRAPFLIKKKVASIGASIGIALSPDDGVDSQTLIKNADLAMYHAKYEGKNTYAFYNQQLTKDVERTTRIKQDLGRAFIDGEFELYFQPQIELHTGKIIGSEALIRWNHPQRGLVMPGEFISVAEESGLIGKIDEWVLQAACLQLQKWNKAMNFGKFIAVNLSPQQLTDTRLPTKLDRLLAQNGLEPRNLHLEVTETMLIKDEVHVANILREVANLGCPIWLDDFGTGFSSLSHLQRFPLSGIKLDRKFVSNLSEETTEQQLAQAIITLGKMLGLEVIAEGVESEYQAQLLKQWHCPYAQGFYFYTPLPGIELESILHDQQRSPAH